MTTRLPEEDRRLGHPYLCQERQGCFPAHLSEQAFFGHLPRTLIDLIFDAPLQGERTAAGKIRLNAGPMTLRDLIRDRLQQEVDRYNQTLPETFQGLVQPEESEQAGSLR